MKSVKLAKVEYDFPSDPRGWNGIALVGEAPGAEEVKRGHPFVGPSGERLKKILEDAGIDRLPLSCRQRIPLPTAGKQGLSLFHIASRCETAEPCYR